MELAEGADGMTTKATGLAAFTRRGTAQSSAVSAEEFVPETTERQRAKKDVVALTVRLQRAEWERLHQLAVSEGMSIQALAVRGLNRVFTEKGLPKLAEGK
jgi:hypothetical protein